MSWKNLARLVLIAGIVLVAVTAWRTGLLHELDVDRVRDVLRASGPAGALAFLAAFCLIQPLHVSAYVFIISASLVWSTPLAIALSSIGALSAKLVLFGFAHFVAHDWIQGRVPERFRRYDERLEHQGFKTVLMLRLVFFTTPALQMAMGVSRVRLRDFAVASAIGNVPWVIFGTLMGARLSGWLLGA